MSRYDAILVPHDGSAEAAKAMRCAAWLAERLDALLHVVCSGAATLEPIGDARAVLHRTADAPEAAVLEEIRAHEVKLVVMTARGASASAGLEPARPLGRVAQAVIERTPVPVLLLPTRYVDALPWRTMLVAASGERAADAALDAAVELAGALGVPISVVHCASERAPGAPLGAYADAPHHELPGRLDELVGRGLVERAAAEQGAIHEVLLCRGDPADELLELLLRRPASVLALGWHGVLGAQRAPVLQRLLEEADCALLVVRGSERARARLKVGAQLDG
jgi:nucleotide-binding universal stress UspA family protein